MLAGIPLILPAGGRSSRLGFPKGLQQHEGRFWIEIQCAAYAAAGGRRVLLVLGYDRERYREAFCPGSSTLPNSASLGGCEVHLLVNPQPERGPFSSLQCAARWIQDAVGVNAAFFLPIDTPLPNRRTLEDLAAALRSPKHVAEPRCEGRGGHPVLLGRDVLTGLTRLAADHAESRLDVQIRALRTADRVTSVPASDARILLNLNDAAAWNRYFASLDRP